MCAGLAEELARNGSGWGSVEPTLHETYDYIVICVLVLVFMIGAPLNLALFTQLWARLHSLAPNELLKLQLIVANLLILFVYAVSRICWHIAFDWNGGLVLCKLVKFGHELAFQSSSAVLAAIGLERLWTVVRPFPSASVVRRRVRVLVVTAWAYAFFFSSPQFFIFTVIPSPRPDRPHRMQCASVWSIWDYENRTTTASETLNKALNAVHMTSIFWLPLSFMLISYSVIARQVWRYSQSGSNASVKGGQRSETLPLQGTTQTRLSQLKPALSSAAASGSPRAKKSVVIVTTTRDSSVASKRHVVHQTLRTTLMLISVYVIFWCPYHVSSLWSYFDREGFREKQDLMRALELLMTCTCLINPFIYGLEKTCFYRLHIRERVVLRRFLSTETCCTCGGSCARLLADFDSSESEHGF